MAERKKHNWPELKAEFIPSGLSVNAFAHKHGLQKDNAYRVAKRDGWLEARKKVVTRAEDKALTKMTNTLANHWESFFPLLQDVKAHCERLMKTTAPDGREVYALAKAIGEVLKSEKLIRGEPQKNVSNLNLHQVLIQEIGKSDKGFQISPEDFHDTTISE